VEAFDPEHRVLAALLKKPRCSRKHAVEPSLDSGQA
jgi:hypothetical protein